MLKFSLPNSLQSFGSLFLIRCEKLPIYGNDLSIKHLIKLILDENDVTLKI